MDPQHRDRGPTSGVPGGGRSTSSRVADVLATVVARGDRSAWPMALVEDCSRALDADGAGLAVADAGGPLAVVAATAGLGQVGEDLQFSLGDGPCRLASVTGRMVHSPHLVSDVRWAGFAREAAAHGIGAAFSAPLQVGAVRLGVLDVYRRDAGALPLDALETLRVHADAAVAVLLLLADEATPAGSTADLAELADVRPVVHQAAGMVAVQLDVTLEAALARLRAAAFAADRRLRAVAADVVARRVRFDHTEAGMVGREVPEHGDAARHDADGDRHQPDGGEDPEERRLG